MKLKVEFNSPVILVLAFLSVAVYFINDWLGQALSPFFTVPPSFNFSNPLAYFTLFSYILGHGSTAHLMGNLMLLLLIGPVLEERYGSRKLIIMVLITTFVTAILNMLLFDTGIQGMSGVVFMLIILVSFVNVKKGSIPLTFILVVIFYIGNEIVMSFQEDQVSQFGHIMGGLLGSVFGFSGYIQSGSRTASNT